MDRKTIKHTPLNNQQIIEVVSHESRGGLVEWLTSGNHSPETWEEKRLVSRWDFASNIYRIHHKQQKVIDAFNNGEWVSCGDPKIPGEGTEIYWAMLHPGPDNHPSKWDYHKNIFEIKEDVEKKPLEGISVSYYEFSEKNGDLFTHCPHKDIQKGQADGGTVKIGSAYCENCEHNRQISQKDKNLICSHPGEEKPIPKLTEGINSADFVNAPSWAHKLFTNQRRQEAINEYLLNQKKTN